MDQNELFPNIDESMKDAAEKQIQEKQKDNSFDIREYPIDILVHKLTEGAEDDLNEIYVPEYQRELVWSEVEQSRFIESILMNLPVPYIFLADTGAGSHREGRLEIIDGSQRLRTLARFVENDLILDGLKKLPLLNGFCFRDLTKPRQLRFKRYTLRSIELTRHLDEEARRELFDRLNTGGKKLKDMEQRRGSNDGPFLKFIEELAKDLKFRRLCPLSESKVERREYEELVLRFFAYKDRYQAFEHDVEPFLTGYLVDMNECFSANPAMASGVKKVWEDMLNFVEETYPCGFKKNGANQSVPRIRFEALAVGSSLAISEKENLKVSSVNWLFTPEFKAHTRSDAANSRTKVMGRIEYVRDQLLNAAL